MSPTRPSRPGTSSTWPSPWVVRGQRSRISRVGDTLPAPPTWTEQAACAGLAPMFDTQCTDEPHAAWEARRREAIAVCGTCPVLGLCGAYADKHDLSGVWGGRVRGTNRRSRSEEYPDAHLLNHPYLTTDDRSTTA